jgi:hypothetical protein
MIFQWERVNSPKSILFLHKNDLKERKFMEYITIRNILLQQKFTNSVKAKQIQDITSPLKKVASKLNMKLITMKNNQAVPMMRMKSMVKIHRRSIRKQMKLRNFRNMILHLR